MVNTTSLACQKVYIISLSLQYWWPICHYFRGVFTACARVSRLPAFKCTHINFCVWMCDILRFYCFSIVQQYILHYYINNYSFYYKNTKLITILDNYSSPWLILYRYIYNPDGALNIIIENNILSNYVHINFICSSFICSIAMLQRNFNFIIVIT